MADVSDTVGSVGPAEWVEEHNIDPPSGGDVRFLLFDPHPVPDRAEEGHHTGDHYWKVVDNGDEERLRRDRHGDP